MQRPLILLLALSTAGCAFDDNDLHTWKSVANGDQRLAAYLAERDRPLDRRVRAARYLLEMGKLGQIMGVLHATPEDDRKKLLSPLSLIVTEYIADDRIEVQSYAKDLAYYLLEYDDLLDATAGEKLRHKLLDWSLDRINRGAEVRGIKIGDVLLGLAVAHEQEILPQILSALSTAREVPVVLRLTAILSKLKDKQVAQQNAAALLAIGQTQFPVIDLQLVDAIARNGNDTLMYFLLDAARSPDVPLAVRDEALVVALKHLGKKAIPGLLRLIATDDPVNGNPGRWVGLEEIWRLSGVERLRAMLRALPVDGTYSEVGDRFKQEVDAFCDARIAAQKVAARPVLLGLVQVDDTPHWVSRVFAAECIMRLYPDEAAHILRPLRRDDTRLKGWRQEGETTLGEVIRQLGKG